MELEREGDGERERGVSDREKVGWGCTIRQDML